MTDKLSVNTKLLCQLSEEYGDAYYLFDARLFRQNLDSFRKAFCNHYPKVEIGYSYKTNYIPRLCKIAKDKGAYAEVVSGMEYELAEKVGYSGREIIFNGPYKEKRELIHAFNQDSIIHFDSYEEIKVLKEYLDEYPDKQVRCALRCNFDIGENSRSRFGFDVSNGDVETTYQELFDMEGCKPIGIHCHFSTQHRSVESYSLRTSRLIELAKKIFKEHDLQYIDVGGGFFGDMPDEVKKLFEVKIPSFREYGKAVGEVMKKHFPDAKTSLLLEPGVAVVANTMKFICQVHSIKKIGQKKVVTLSGSKHNVRPTGSSGNIPFRVIRNDEIPEQLENALIGGYTCMEYDIITQNYKGQLAVGDFLIFDNMGAYNIVFKPPFIKGTPPIIEFDMEKKEQVIIKAGETMDDIFSTYKF